MRRINNIVFAFGVICLFVGASAMDSPNLVPIMFIVVGLLAMIIGAIK